MCWRQGGKRTEQSEEEVKPNLWRYPCDKTSFHQQTVSIGGCPMCVCLSILYPLLNFVSSNASGGCPLHALTFFPPHQFCLTFCMFSGSCPCICASLHLLPTSSGFVSLSGGLPPVCLCISSSSLVCLTILCVQFCLTLSGGCPPSHSLLLWWLPPIWYCISSSKISFCWFTCSHSL